MGSIHNDEGSSATTVQSDDPAIRIKTASFPENVNGPEKGIPIEDVEEDRHAENVFPITIKLPHPPGETQIMVSTQEQVQDIRQSIVDSADSFAYSCFHLELNGRRVNDFVELSEVEGFDSSSELHLIEDPYTEKDARMHLIRIREIIGAAVGERADLLYGVSAGLSLHDTVCPWKGPEGAIATVPPTANHSSVNGDAHALDDFDFDSPPRLQRLLAPNVEPPSKTVKSLGLSQWNPPPPFLRQQGHLLYLLVTTNEGEQYHITSDITGFFLNKSTTSKFDPSRRTHPKSIHSHSLFTLLVALSDSFKKTFDELQVYNSKRDPLATFQLTNAIPTSPWFVPSGSALVNTHQADLTRTQETYLNGGLENTETLRDWNEEIQSTKELPRETVQDRIFRERLISKIYAEFNEAAARGACLVLRGEVPPLNPTECKDAQIFVYNNIFYSFGADGVGTFTSEGGDEAARVAVSKDVAGVKAVNQLDFDKAATPGTIIVDYLGKRIVAQSIVPGIFKQRDPDEPQVDYGGVEGRDVIADNEAFVPIFAQVSKALKVKKHSVWDKEGKEHELEASVETKGLLGTDGRKYILDLYRLTPLDILWIEENRDDSALTDENYPHRMTVLRQELIDLYWRLKLSEHVKEQVRVRGEKKGDSEISGPLPIENGNGNHVNGDKPASNGTIDAADEDDHEDEDEHKKEADSSSNDHVDISSFSFTLNPDVYCGQQPQTDEQKAEWAEDESAVRAVCQHLRERVIPELLNDLKEGEVGFPMDGQSLAGLLHKRGINIRYLGKIATLTDDQNKRMQHLRSLAVQEMNARAVKHVANRYLKDTPPILAQSCLAHILNCAMGIETPKPKLSETISNFFPKVDFAFSDLTPSKLQIEVTSEVQRRFRYTLDATWVETTKSVQFLRNICLKLGIQLASEDYAFLPVLGTNERGKEHAEGPTVNGLTNGHSNGKTGKKKKKNGGRSSPALAETGSGSHAAAFVAEDIANVVPLVKDASPKSRLAEEALEAGKISMMQNQKDMGAELLLESLTLHEQIYGILHPEVARVYHQLAMLYYQLEEKSAAIELAHKAVIISERTLGVDSSETILAYLNLALFEHGNKNTPVALSYVRHALELWKIIYGPGHPDCTTTLNNAAVMLQNLQAYHKSREWFELSLTVNEEISGKSTVSTATLLFQLAQALVLDGDHKGAVKRMREAYSIFLSKLGANDPNTKESEKWLEQLTSNAVSMAKHAKDLQARRTRRIMLNPRAADLTASTELSQSAPVLNGNSNGHANGGLDSRSIEELLKFIEGGGDVTRTTPSKKRSTHRNPRGRGKGQAGSSSS